MGTRHDVVMATEIRVLDGEDELLAAANVFSHGDDRFLPCQTWRPARSPRCSNLAVPSEHSSKTNSLAPPTR